MARRTGILLGLGLALLPATAEAHKLKIFATVAGNEVQGKVYFVGGGVARHAVVSVESPDGEPIERLAADAEGRFTMSVRRLVDHVFIANLADGHVAKFLLAVEPPTAESRAGAGAARDSTDPATAAIMDAQELALVVEKAVARQVQPLQLQLNAYDDRLWLRDILGGLGFILGLFGIAAWLKARQRNSRQSQDATS